MKGQCVKKALETCALLPACCSTNMYSSVARASVAVGFCFWYLAHSFAKKNFPSGAGSSPISIFCSAAWPLPPISLSNAASQNTTRALTPAAPQLQLLS